MTHIIICDDSPKDMERLSFIIKKYYVDDPVTIHTFYSGIELVDYIEKGGPCHIAFLDIIMPNFNGIELARNLRSVQYSGYIIFMSYSNNYAMESYQVSAFSYLLKPADTKLVFSLLDAVTHHRKTRDTACLLIHTKQNKQTLLFQDIIFLESIGHYLVFHLTDSTISVYSNFQQYEPSLMKDSRFVRCHRAFIINMDHVVSVQKQEFNMYGNIAVPISKNFMNAKKQYIQYILEKDIAYK